MRDLEDTWWMQALLIVAINLGFTYLAFKLMVVRQDGMQRIGWTENEVIMAGKKRNVFIPIYIKVQDYNELNSPGGK